jgi:hypothetical protein
VVEDSAEVAPTVHIDVAAGGATLVPTIHQRAVGAGSMVRYRAVGARSIVR